MAEAPFFSSQGSEYDRHQTDDEQENCPATTIATRERKPPTVTPKRFKKFFTPRATVDARSKQSKASRRLRDITKNGTNQRRYNDQAQKSGLEDEDDHGLRPTKRQKRSIDIASSPPQTSPLKQTHNVEDIEVYEDSPASPLLSDEEELSDLAEQAEAFPQPIRRLNSHGSNHRIVERSFGGFDAHSRGRRWHDHCADWRLETANFVSTPSDIHPFTGSALPFCTASCNTNSLVAIGEEEGIVRLIDTNKSSDFPTAHISFRPHHNAIMDMAFSSDDYMLATAGGCQTGRIVDMHTQQSLCILSGHKSSLKQIRFHPNDDNMITTSSRDGSVLLWDMRCGGKGAVTSLRTATTRDVDLEKDEPTVRYSRYSLDVGSAHRLPRKASTRVSSNGGTDAGSVSITAVEHLKNDRGYLLLTSSESSSMMRLWDLRNVGRRSSGALVSNVPAPPCHSTTRNYGINAMVLSGDGARLYTVCRDGVVYAYSTYHLALGDSTAVSQETGAKVSSSLKVGIGPLYGFRHSALRLGTFYIRAALRPARGDKVEMLAVGSSDNCAVLLPTDERHLQQRTQPLGAEKNKDDAELPAITTGQRMSPRSGGQNGIPIHEHGTALTRGHDKEVTSLAWSYDGDLVTLGDDYIARCWREDGDQARQLRGCGESGGQRWGHGWADMRAGWDDEDC